ERASATVRTQDDGIVTIHNISQGTYEVSLMPVILGSSTGDGPPAAGWTSFTVSDEDVDVEWAFDPVFSVDMEVTLEDGELASLLSPLRDPVEFLPGRIQTLPRPEAIILDSVKRTALSPSARFNEEGELMSPSLAAGDYMVRIQGYPSDVY